MAAGWRFEISDPTARGWITVGAYLLAAALCGLWARRLRAAGERRLVLAMTVVLVLLAANKQLDFQHLLTTTAKTHAREHGWYEHRQLVQTVFYSALGLAAAAAVALLAWWTRGRWRRFGLPILGVLFVGTYVLSRVPSNHGVDTWLAGLPLARWYEVVGAGLVAIGATMGVRKS